MNKDRAQEHTSRFPALAACAIAALLFSAGLWIAGTVTEQRQNRFDIFPHLVALREFTAGHSPYTEAVMHEIQRGYYGRLAQSGEDLHRISYPAYAYVLLAPLRPLNNQAAIMLWMALQLPAAFVALCLWAGLEQRLTLTWVFVCLILALTWRYAITIFLNAQFNALLLVFYSAGLALLARRRDRWAGGVMAVSALQPTLMAPIGLLQLGGLALRGRWRGLAAWLGVLLALTAISIAVIGWWLPDWLNALAGYASYQRHLTWVPQRFGVLWFIAGLAFASLPLVRPCSLAGSYALIVIGLLLILPQTGVYYLIALLPVLLIALQRAVNRTGRRRWVVIVLAALCLAASWAFLPLDFEAAKLESLFMPLAVLGLFASGSWPTSPRAQSSPSGAAHAGTPPVQP